MKTIRILAISATAASLAAMGSCDKEDVPVQVPVQVPAENEPISTLILSIEQPTDESTTKTVLGAEVSGTYPVNWSAGDKIAVSALDSDTFEEYTLSAGAGGISGTFTGNAVKGAVCAYYPYDYVKYADSGTYTVDIPTRQIYVTGSFGEKALPMYGVAAGTAGLKSLKPLMSVLKLNLKGVCKVNRIIVSHATEKLSGSATVTFSGPDATLSIAGTDTYDFVELLCPDVQLEENNATLFHIAVPASSAPSSYTVRIITDEGKVLTKTLTLSQKFTAGKIKNANEIPDVAPTEVKYVIGSYCDDGITLGETIWAPVNCGYSSKEPKGLLYQWGRKYGQSATEAVTLCTMEKTDDTEGNSNLFGESKTNPYCWHTGDIDDNLWKEDGTGTNEPCPSGWRVPTSNELTVLNSMYSQEITDGGPDHKQAGYLFGSSTTEKVFLPFVGYRKNIDGSLANEDSGYYWSSSTKSSYAYHLRFPKNGVSTSFRAIGCPVRCVKK